MEQYEIKTPQDVLQFMKEHITYGWIDVNGEKHINEMKDFRKLYQTMSIEQALENQLGVCVEQVAIIHHLLDQIQVENKMFCCRIYEPDDYGNLEEDEHMHCFCLYYLNDKVYHLEHPNCQQVGIYEYEDEADAISHIVDYYVKLRGGKESPTTPFYEVPGGLSFQQFNAYINHQELK